MKTVLKFNNEEKHELVLALNADKMYSALWNASKELRGLLKYRDDLDFSEEQQDAIQLIREDIEETIDYIESQ